MVAAPFSSLRACHDGLVVPSVSGSAHCMCRVAVAGISVQLLEGMTTLHGCCALPLHSTFEVLNVYDHMSAHQTPPWRVLERVTSGTLGLTGARGNQCMHAACLRLARPSCWSAARAQQTQPWGIPLLARPQSMTGHIYSACRSLSPRRWSWRSCTSST